MANLTPDYQLSSYKHLNHLLSGNQDKLDEVHLVQVSPNLMYENMEQPILGPIIAQSNLEGSPSQSSSQRQKRGTSEEAQLYLQKLEHEQMLKRQQQENNQVNSEAQRLKQVEWHLAHEANERNRKCRFFWNEESTWKLLEMIKELNIDFVNMEETTSGFIPWTQFFKMNENCKQEFKLLKDLAFETLERQYKNIKDSCDETGGEGLYIQLQQHHMTMEVYDLLKDINQNNYGTNEVCFESGDFQAPENNNNGESIEEDIEVPMEPSGNQGCHSGSENGESGTREEMGRRISQVSQKVAVQLKTSMELHVWCVGICPVKCQASAGEPHIGIVTS
ncbi:hypothetical protein O181_114041 [Austropuccinia psidii MF-1]|uniref:Uncharacterized protein n=1 Tax=Austropuccinia psidii MF-1 TaxID=1389203 RepID=A0A9Q3PV00_9BASI|nr:hypothetical protein [Austropuccinia psidii MF-1]